MRYVSLDLETTGLDPERHQILEIAAVIEDTKNIKPLDDLPSFHSVIEHDQLHGSPLALAMNAGWYSQETNKQKLTTVPGAFCHWLMDHFLAEKVTFAGANVGTFDWQFIKKWKDSFGHPLKERVNHRFIEIGSVFFDPEVGPLSLSSLAVVKHRALDDAKLVIDLLRRNYAYSTIPSVVPCVS